MQRFLISLVTLSLCFALTLSAEACILRKSLDPVIPRLVLPKAGSSTWEQENYFQGLLRLILERTEAEYGPCDLAHTQDVITRMRSAALIDRNGGVDLFWATTTIEREKLLHPIRISLLKDLTKHKLLLIRANDQARFSKVQNLEQLQALRAGTGADWPDSTILLANGLNVVSSTNYESLYKMLAAKRFDFFPRASSQVWSELRVNGDKKLAVERELVLVYPAPIYFFVKKNNTTLARRIEAGLQEIIADGTFDRYFNQHPLIIETLAELRLNKRRVIFLENALLPKVVPAEGNEVRMIESLAPVVN